MILCGKVEFSVGREYLFFNKQIVEKNNFSTYAVEIENIAFYPQIFYPHSTDPVENYKQEFILEVMSRMCVCRVSSPFLRASVTLLME